MKRFEKLNETYQKLYQELENDDTDKNQEVFDLEQQVQEELEFAMGNEQHELKGLLNRIKQMKKEFDLYDEEAELDSMFPNRNDDDFDEDSMSPNNVFKDD